MLILIPRVVLGTHLVFHHSRSKIELHVTNYKKICHQENVINFATHNDNCYGGVRVQCCLQLDGST